MFYHFWSSIWSAFVDERRFEMVCQRSTNNYALNVALKITQPTILFVENEIAFYANALCWKFYASKLDAKYIK